VVLLGHRAAAALETKRPVLAERLTLRAMAVPLSRELLRGWRAENLHLDRRLRYAADCLPASGHRRRKPRKWGGSVASGTAPFDFPTCIGSSTTPMGAAGHSVSRRRELSSCFVSVARATTLLARDGATEARAAWADLVPNDELAMMRSILLMRCPLGSTLR
jgi:hypothetical protein